ncbi:ribonuclease HII [Candidatus Dependentiae bacterium]
MAIKIKENDFKKNFYETKAWQANSFVCGVDEVGRGCIAGPLVTAAAILPINTTYPNLKDSKSMSQKELLTAYRWISNNGTFSIGIVSNNVVDKFNIRQATLIAMKKALIGILSQTENMYVSTILVDAMPVTLSNTAYKDIPVQYFEKGESKSISIAAASIVAKVTRDRIMGKLDALFPGYQLRNHKGYGTKVHKQALKKHKPTIIHRESFLNKTFNVKENDNGNQLSIY